MRILVIDDEESLCTLAAEYLRLAGHETAACADGESALALLQGDVRFDAIVLDKRLPGLTGVEVFRAIKADPRLAGVPVVVLSASVSPEAIPDNMPGAALHLAKPFHPKELAAALTALQAGRKP